MAEAKILIVEDNWAVAEDIQNRLKNLGYGVSAMVSSGEEAINKVKEDSPDLVLMDIVLKGGVDGIEAAEQIHANFNVPVVYLTAYADEELVERAKITKPLGYITKPFEDTELHTAIEIALYKHKAEEALRESEEIHRITLSNISDAVFITDNTGAFTYICPNVEVIFGYAYPEVDTFANISKLLDNSLFDSNELKASGEIRNIECEIKDKTGETHVLLVNVKKVSIKSGTVLYTCRDISERKKIEEELRESEEKHRNLFETMAQGVVYQNAKGKIISANPAAERILGLSLDQMQGRTSIDPKWKSIHEDGSDFPGETHPAIVALRTGETLKGEVMGVFNPDEEDYRWINIHAVPQFKEGENKPCRVYTTFDDITDRKKNEEALRESEERYRTLVELSPDAIFVHQEGKFVYINRVGVRTFGATSSEELIGKLVFDFIHPDYHEIVRERIEIIHDGRKPLNSIEEKFIRVDGEAIDVDATGAYVTYDDKPATISIIRNVTERKQMEKALQESEKKFRTLFEDSRDAIYINTREGRFIDVNQSMLELFGYTRDELMGTNIIELYANPDDRPRVLEKFDKEGSLRDYEVMYKKKDGTKIDGLVTATVRWGRDGSILGYQGIMRDLSEKKRLEAQLQQAQKMEAMGTLAGGIAHDFNNLLMGIQGNASLMLLNIDSSHPDYEKLQAVEKMVRSGSKLTGQLLGYARKGRYEAKPINLNKLVKESAETFGRTRKEITIQREFEEDLSAIEADQVQIEQVLWNLYVNAADAMPGGGDLILKTMNITHEDMRGKLYKPRPGKYVRLDVIDTGIGMDKETRERIFEPFFTTKEMGRGTGLGLASAYGIIKAHGGYVDVESEKGRGTILSIYLPASDKEAEKEKEFSGDILRGAETVLFVDDEDMIINVGDKMLKEMGYTVLLARSGKEALELYKVKKEEISMIILDMIMPGMGGGETYDKMKEINPKLKVLLSSGYSIDGQATEILGRGCDSFIQKPFNIKELSQKLRNILDKEKSSK